MVDEEWWPPILEAYGLNPDNLLEAGPDRVLFRIGENSAALWRTPATPEEQAILLSWEELLGPRGSIAARLLARGGAPWVRVDERTLAVSTAWHGADWPRLAGGQETVGLAQFLALFRPLSREAGLPAPVPPGPGWAESWAERARRLESFADLAAARLNPTRFDLIHLEQGEHYSRQARRSAEDLAAVLRGLATGATLREVDRHRFFRGPSGPALKTSQGLARDYPVRDLYRLMARVLPRLSWSRQAAGDILAAYHRVWPLEEAEVAALQAGLRFPHEYYRLAYHYYLNRKTWPLRTFLRKQEEIMGREPERLLLVEEVPLLLPA